MLLTEHQATDPFTPVSHVKQRPSRSATDQMYEYMLQVKRFLFCETVQ